MTSGQTAKSPRGSTTSHEGQASRKDTTKLQNQANTALAPTVGTAAVDYLTTLALDKALGRMDLAVASRLAARASWWDRTGTEKVLADVQVSASKIAADLDSDRTSVRKALRKLESRGWIVSTQQKDEFGSCIASIYWLQIPTTARGAK